MRTSPAIHFPKVTARPKVRTPPSGQGGWFLMEVMAAMILSAVVGIYASRNLQQTADDATAASTGVYLDNLAQAGQRYILANFVALTDGADVSGVVNDLAPTMAELMALGRLPPGFPSTTPTRQGASLALNRTNCPGPSCQITATACLASALTVRGRVRDDLATTAMLAMQGRGGRSREDAPGLVRGPSMTITNPHGPVNAVVCGQSLVDAGLYDSFVRLGDTRDPNLKSGLTVSGTNATGETIRSRGDIAVVDPASGNVCVRILSGGTININCAGQLNATTGTFTGPNGTVRVGSTGTTYAVDTAGRIRGEAGFWSAVGSVFGDNSLGIRASGATFTVQTSSGVDALAVHDSGRTGSRTSVATPLLGLTGAVTPGTSCASPASQVGATQVTTAANTVIGSLAGGGLAICDSASGQWLSVSRTATSGSGCTTNGSSAQSSTGVLLVCTNGIWTSITDRMGYLVAAESWRAVDGSVIPKPTCGPGSTGSRLVATPGNEQQNIQFVNRYVTDNGSSWTFRMVNGSNVSIGGDVLVMSYCSY